MTEKLLCSDDGLEYAKKLVECIEQGKADEATKTLEDLSALRESHLFQELGKLTRDLHDALRGFRVDSEISHLAEKDIPDAKERLNYVITMTEQAADKTLTAVESSLTLSNELIERASRLQENWGRFRKRDMDVEEFRTMSGDLDEFFQWLDKKGPEINSRLSEKS